MSVRLKGKRALVYGGGSGIGLACSAAMLTEGSAICLSGRRESVLQASADSLKHLGRVFFCAGDATSVSDVQRVTSQAVGFLGGLDTIVISAGVGGRTTILDCEPGEFQRIIDGNIRAAFLRSAAMDLADKGVRVNAICPGFVETPLALQVARGEPDPQAHLEARRNMHPIPRGGRLDEMGELAVYLASDLSAFVTGQAIAIDGGYSAR
jgi:NAD(P)-dependent dehydrogenase (short-subunit alcohol dehydrogenase family)